MPIDYDKPIGGPTPEEDRIILETRVNELNDLASQGEFNLIDQGIKSIERFRIPGDGDPKVAKVSSGRNDPRMLIVDYMDQDGVPGSTEVFVKVSTPKKIANELACTEICEQGGVETFKPFATIDDGRDGYYITRRRNVIPFSEYFIQDFQDFEKLLRLGASKFKQINDLGIHHKDAKPKNIALDLETEEVVVYDFEVSDIYPPKGLPHEVRGTDVRLTFLLEMKYWVMERGKRAQRGGEYHWYHDHAQDVANLLLEVEKSLGT